MTPKDVDKLMELAGRYGYTCYQHGRFRGAAQQTALRLAFSDQESLDGEQRAVLEQRLGDLRNAEEEFRVKAAETKAELRKALEAAR